MSAKLRIDAAAIDLFVRLGVDASTTKLIAAGAGVSEGAIYRHYKSKDELALTLFMGAHRRLSALVEDAAAEAPDMKTRAAAVVRAYCQAADENWPLFTFHMLSIHRYVPYYQNDGRDPVTVVENVIKRGMINAEIPPGDPEILGAMAIGAILQVAQNRAYGRIHLPMSAYAPAMIAAVQAILTAR